MELEKHAARALAREERTRETMRVSLLAHEGGRFDYKPWPYDTRYWVSVTGTVFDMRYCKFVAQHETKKGYKTIKRLGNDRREPFVHVMVLETHIGPRVGDAVCRHIDGNKANNCLSNLAWGTRRQNGLDCKWHDKPNRGIKLRPPAVLDIKRRLAGGETKMALARKFGVAPATIFKIAVGATHADVA